jgi:hypothetical protein
VRISFRNNVLLANQPGSLLFRLTWWGQRKQFPFVHRKVFTETFSSDANHWYQTGTDNNVAAFLSNSAELKLNASDDLPSLSWQQWREAEYQGAGKRQDQNSTWGSVSTQHLDAYDPTSKTAGTVRVRGLVSSR